ncbi:4-hydroxyproline 2-epimerase [Rhodobacter sphaeroides]|jgi:Proline racemase|uniref:4-hydroxyproline 2-epimerase n=1 Tax=Cereibacter sphaeroides (strain ATCC 17023 / DSM 158 / JCM 6121 / CCUG 31486 / LMG 2827 / NBRC 12203 / NCIMB 8253 / ATH 2.4.1.) TaxID=272943 RepID=4HYPE_CERS4|nr:proline racemase family protein [Cereibacter sphaeroides]Q3IWG2.1 RecName: Full=4-hydroxyproline 2-epimerase; Short=4Hyp 2-epimerase; Short=4HypE [Cereibacter sphaeroides 2.4.1]ABA81122.1 proline racemase [Cereibacter sphaeroides 2.4.1]ACM03547.1 Proline racemase [Cereibacter sphaeroides KD131]AMJ49431.1 proline racemase [Cereibacter sphaeroides]ANS36143.1 proline racemase [Cereibacter sphaeroides]ATN65209.1 proline racemase [Cereibacter sphaeroides]
MRVQDVYNVIYTHTEGEPLCIIYSGVPYPAGSTILEKRAFLEENYDWLRKALMREPRGHADMFGVFLTPPSSRDYDAGLIYIDGKEYSHMCGHGTIAVAMAMVANGLVARDPSGLTRIRFETTAGLVVAEVAHEGDRVLWTRFENVPAYVAAQDIAFELPGYGPLKADLVWGGNYFGIIDLRGTSLRIAPENGSELSRMGLIAREEIRKKVKVQHPTEAHINNLNFVTFWHEPTIEGCLYKNVHVFSAGQLDRSPGGTGTSAMMAYFEARGVIGLNQPITSEGLLGSGTFEGCLIGETTLGTVRAVRPTVKGTAGMLGTASWTINREDPVDAGFLVL